MSGYTWRRITEKDAAPGDFILCRATRRWIDEPLRRATGSPWVHGGVFVGDGLVVDSSRMYELGTELDEVANLRDPQFFRVNGLSELDRTRACAEAIKLLGTPFPSWVPFAVAMVVRHRTTVTAPFWSQPWWVRQLLNGSNTVYCLQVIDLAYRNAGIKLFDDGRPEGLVTPRCFLDRISPDLIPLSFSFRAVRDDWPLAA